MPENKNKSFEDKTKLQAANQQLTATEEKLRRVNRDMVERIKELNCLYGLSELIEQYSVGTEKVFKGLVDLIPPAWQYPEITAARITFEGHRFKTSNFRKTAWIQSADIKVRGQKSGIIEVCYLKKMSAIDEGPFLKEERSLLNALAERMGSIIVRKQAEEAIKAANQQLKASNQQLMASEQQLRAANQQLNGSNQQLRANEEQLCGLTHDLGERVKELNCLYELSQLVERRDITLEEVLQGLAELIPPGWQYPEITAARITFEGHRFKTSNFRKTAWTQSADIDVHGQKSGIIEVCYLNKRPVIDEGPFLKEERSLLNTLAERMGSIIVRKQAEGAIKAANQQIKASNQQLVAAEQQLRAANQQLRASEEALREERNLLRTLIDNMPDYIYIKDAESRFIVNNVAHLRSLGAAMQDKVAGKTDFDIFPNELAARFYADEQQVIRSGKPLVNREEATKDADGRKQWLLTTKVPMLDSRGKVTGLVGISRDITERKQMGEEILNEQKQLRSLAAQLSLTEERERRRIAEGLHDDIIQPLTFLDVKLKTFLDSSINHELSDSFHKMRTVIAELIHDTRTFTFDLSYPVLYELGFEKAVKQWSMSEVEEKHGVKTVFGDDGQNKPLGDDMRVFLFKAVKELLVNVVKHAEATKVKISIAREGDNVVVCVEDDGVGFSIHQKKKADIAEMTGFGLFSIHDRLDYLGGSFDIESKPGGGTRAIITAPLKHES